MCGVAGLYEYRSQRPVDADLLRGMTDCISHRGPDDSGFHLADGIGLGMRRLSIIDIEFGKQPMTNETGDVVVIFNGEIYNHRELRRRLEGLGHTLMTSSDTEVIPHLYEEYGLDFVQHLRGMFAIALWDSKARQLVLARDRLGIKPLYYVDNGHRLLFGSEIKAILQDREIPSRLDLQSLNLFLSLKYVPAPRTMFEGIRSLPPGCMLVVDESGSEVVRYWDVIMSPPAKPMDDIVYEEEFSRLMRQTVGLHMQSDVAFGVFLSGGLDSSLIATLMSEVMTQPVKTFSIGFTFNGEPRGELQYARAVARYLKSDHHEVLMNGTDFVNNAERAIHHLDQPIADAAGVATLLLSDLASSSVKMVMSGEGGDELFAGYGRYLGERFAPLLRPLPSRVRRRVLLRIRDFIDHPKLQVGLYALAHADFIDRLANWFPLFNDDMKRSLVSPMLEASAATASSQSLFASSLEEANASDPLSSMLYSDIRYWLPDLLLLRGDKMTMAASIELRVPLLDHEVVEFAGNLPRTLKLRGLTRKVLLRRTGEGVLPKAIIERKKEGFPLPIDHWWRGDARELLEDCLSPVALRSRGLFDVQNVSQLVREQQGGQNHGLKLWGLVGLELWLREHIDRRHFALGAPSPVADLRGKTHGPD